MKLHRSFGKTLAVATIAFMISSAASAQAQQGRSGRDRCFHSERVRPAVRGPMVPPVYMYPVPNAGRSYRDYRRGERPLLTGQRWADMAAEQEALRARRLQTLGALKSQLEILVQARQAQLAAQRRTLQDAPTMSPKARASQELAGQQMVGPQMQGLIRSILPNDSSATPKPNCTIISSSDCY